MPDRRRKRLLDGRRLERAYQGSGFVTAEKRRAEVIRFWYTHDRDGFFAWLRRPSSTIPKSVTRAARDAGLKFGGALVNP